MFTGIVEVMGRIQAVEDRATTRRFRLEAPEVAPELELGDSVAVDGACLTVAEYDRSGFSVDVIGTTLERTIAGGYEVGGVVNLERALAFGDRLDGHLVQGHVDGVGHLESIREDGEFWRLRVRLPGAILRSTVLHGSITLNGVSLTVSDLLEENEDSRVEIGIIPHTWRHTNLRLLKPGNPVNVEADLIGKYVGRLMAPHLE